jgi:hypothetical protein
VKDITGITEGADADPRVIDALTPKAANCLQVQLGELEYAQDFGVDLDFFLDPDLKFQNASFKAYLVQRLAEMNVNVSQVLEALEQFVLSYTFEVGEPTSSGGMIE